MSGGFLYTKQLSFGFCECNKFLEKMSYWY